MQKWCPEAFDTAVIDQFSGVIADSEFSSDSTPAITDEESLESRFRSESRFTSSEALLNHLTRKERATLFDLVEQDVATEYEEKAAENLKQQAQQLKTLEDSFHQGLENLASEMDAAWGRRIKEMSEASARLAIQLAEKIVRAKVAVDETVVARALETAHYKLKDASELSVTVSPDDLVYLEKQSELLKGMKIAHLSSDRRIQRGGCIVKAQDEQWDASVNRQLETLGEIIEEAIARAEPTNLREQPEKDNEPEVE